MAIRRPLGVAFGFLLVVFLVECAAAQRSFIVGDSTGWAVPPGGAALYANWASGKNFAVGDILTFNFATNAHDVLRVPKASFDSCSEDNGIGDIITTGPVNITLEAAGEHYYICTIGRHCLAGQKLAINVSGTPGAPTAPTTPTTPSPPTSGNTPPACAPVPTPSGSTVPTGLRGPTPPPPPPSSSSSKVLASFFFVPILAIIMGLLF